MITDKTAIKCAKIILDYINEKLCNEIMCDECDFNDYRNFNIEIMCPHTTNDNLVDIIKDLEGK